MTNKNNIGQEISQLFTIIIIEDNEELNYLIKKKLIRKGFTAKQTFTGQQALSIITGADNELLLIDYKLPDFTAAELLEKITDKLGFTSHFIIMTGFGDEKIAVEMMKKGARDYFVKDATFIDVFTEKIKKICSDIEKENQAKINEQKYRNIFENIQDTYYEVTLEGTILEVSPSVKNLSKGQITREELIGQSLLPYYKNPEERNQFLDILQKKGYINDFEIELKNKDGSIINSSFSSKLIVDKSGRPIKIVGSIRDITDRKKAEEKTSRAEKKFRSMIEHAPDGVVIIDARGIMTYGSPNAFHQFKYNENEILGRSGAEFTHPDDIHEITKVFEKLFIKPSESVTAKYRFKRKDGEYRWIETTFTNLLHDEAVQGIVLNFSDITEKKKAEEDLIRAKEKAEESDRLKSAFLANMSHEIRTPMNGILGFAGLLQEPDLTGEEQQKFIDIIQQSGKRMLSTVNDLIDISRIETGQTQISLSKTDVNKELNSLFSFFSAEAKQKDIQLILENKIPEKEKEIITDHGKFTSILTNLIKNAIKYTNKGFIKIECNKSDSNFLCSVKDTGIGIPKHRQKAVFERFVQADIGDSRVFEGSGLGLAIVKAYVEMLGGKIWLESEESVGSTFFFTLPVQAENVKTAGK